MTHYSRKRVCLFDFPSMTEFFGYEVQSFDLSPYIGPADHHDMHVLASGGLNGYSIRRNLHTAEGLDRLYRQKHPKYIRFLRDFVAKFVDFDLLIFANFNPIHPEVLARELRRPIKILGFIDDPFSSYLRGVPYLWAFDGAFYISPSYDERSLFADKLAQWGCQQRFWWPLRPEPQQKPTASAAFFANRPIDVLYIGKPYGPKIERLARLQKHLGDRFQIFGQWPLKGYYGLMRGLVGKSALWRRVVSVSPELRYRLYCQAKIGFNLHLSEIPRETGNVRMYEVPSHGAMLLSDKGGLDAHASIFAPDREAVFYDSIDDAIDKIEYYLIHEDERVRIAQAGFERVWRDYNWSENLKRLLDWASTVRKLTP